MLYKIWAESFFGQVLQKFTSLVARLRMFCIHIQPACLYYLGIACSMLRTRAKHILPNGDEQIFYLPWDPNPKNRPPLTNPRYHCKNRDPYVII